LTQTIWAHTVKPDYRPPPPLKAGYAAPSFGTRMQVYSYTFSRYRSPRSEGHRPHAIVDRPHDLTPSTSSQLGVGSQYQELHRCAL